jgi:Asp-tRNA(Asn)/Glu-tRNA(Gln) amidotransferase A subunit family amidase
MSAAKSPYIRSEWYIGFRLAPGVDNAFSMRDDKIHAKRRQQMNMAVCFQITERESYAIIADDIPQYTGKEDINIEPTVDRHIMNLVNLIRRKYISTSEEMKTMDLAEKANFFTMDVIVDLATGAPFGDLTEDKDMHNYSRTMAELQPVFAMVGVMGWVSRIIQIPAIGKYMFPTAQDEFGMGKLIASVQPSVQRYHLH